MIVNVRLFVPAIGTQSGTAPAGVGGACEIAISRGILVEADLAIFPGVAEAIGHGGPFVIVVEHEETGTQIKEWIPGRLEEAFKDVGFAPGLAGAFRMATPTTSFTAPKHGDVSNLLEFGSVRDESADVADAASAGPSPEVAAALAAGAQRVLDITSLPKRHGICRWVPWC